VIWFIGSTAVEKYDDAVKNGQLDRLPQIHSNNFAPSIMSNWRSCVFSGSVELLDMRVDLGIPNQWLSVGTGGPFPFTLAIKYSSVLLELPTLYLHWM